MAVYTPLSDDALRTLLSTHYAVGDLHRATGIAQGVENTNYLLEVKPLTGEETRYILTLFEQRVRATDLPFFLGLMQHLARHSIACPLPITRRDGALFGAWEGKPTTLVSFLDGRDRTEAAAQHTQQVGTLLASMHTAAAYFSLQRSNDLSLPGWQALAHKLRGKLDAIHPGLDQMVADELAALAAVWEQVQTLPHGVIHADLFMDNVFFDGDRLSGAIDFYFACNDALAYDVAITLNAWCFAADGSYENEKAEALLAAYHAVRPFTAQEQKLFPYLQRGAALRFLLTRAHDLIFHPEGALVTPKDPMEYVRKLRFHQQRSGA